mmetsp:Transcript_27030/g.62453  ORF Transcript_27030/g.62453 Transcript_27030/m.62453 type:complete len:169 (-) Transcript_27030:729-1235(-)
MVTIFFFRDCANDAWLAFAPHFLTHSSSRFFCVSSFCTSSSKDFTFSARIFSHSCMLLHTNSSSRFSAISITTEHFMSSSNDLSCVTRSRVVLGGRSFPKYEASHVFALASMWFVGSSSSSSSGSLKRARARATRICQPPESSAQGRLKSSGAKPKPRKTFSTFSLAV